MVIPEARLAGRLPNPSLGHQTRMQIHGCRGRGKHGAVR
jgi:hypothetical protein